MTGCAHCQAVAISAGTFRTRSHTYVSTPLKYLLSGVISETNGVHDQYPATLFRNCCMEWKCAKNCIQVRHCAENVLNCHILYRRNTPGYSLYIAQTFLHGIICVCNPAGYISHYGTRTYQCYKELVVQRFGIN